MQTLNGVPFYEDIRKKYSQPLVSENKMFICAKQITQSLHFLRKQNHIDQNFSFD